MESTRLLSFCAMKHFNCNVLHSLYWFVLNIVLSHSTIPAGVYSLFIESKTHIYPMYRLQVDASSQLKSASFVLPGVEYDKPTPIAFELPLQIQSVGTKDYFTVKFVIIV